MAEKFSNAIKATLMVLGFCFAGMGIFFLYSLGEAAGSLILCLLAMLAPFLIILIAIGIVYHFLEGK